MVAYRNLAAVVLVLVATGDAMPQSGPPPRRTTTVSALHEYPGYFHLQDVLVQGELVENGARIVIRGGDDEIAVILNDVTRTSGFVEVRGRLLDVGRLEPQDPRLRDYQGSRDPEKWPRPGEELVLSVASVMDAQPATSPSLRAVALQPWRFEGHKISVTGQFRGRNLFGDLPSAPGKSRYDFVLRYADAAIWVTDLRPRGRDFDLSVDARVDTGRWLQVTGTVSQHRGLAMIAGVTIAPTDPPQLPPVEEQAPPPIVAEPGEVVFSSPTDGERDVPSTTAIRLQFSRGLDPGSVTDRIRVGYRPGPSGVASADPEFTHTYDAGMRAIEIRFRYPLEPFQTIRVEILDGIRTFDGAAIRPWALTFSVGN